jgi:hypothetical protein
VRAFADARPAPSLYVHTGAETLTAPDRVRDGEHGRSWMQGRFREELGARGVPWVEVSGSHEERLVAAVAAVDEVVAAGWQLADPVG